MTDLFENTPSKKNQYTAKDIEVLEGLEPVRKRPGMYIGGTDEPALHHLAAEVLDNSMDEAVAGHASWIEFDLSADGFVTTRDNGRGIPVDPHPKFKDKSALEIVLTTLHSGGKFGGDVYKTSGGLHGVGLSVVNALSVKLHVEIARDKKLWTQSYSRGKPLGKLKDNGKAANKRGTTICFKPDPEIFGDKAVFRPSTLFNTLQRFNALKRSSTLFLPPFHPLHTSRNDSLVNDTNSDEAKAGGPILPQGGHPQL